MSELINIERATVENRKITFSRAKGKKLYYTTSFGEEFEIPINKLDNNGIKRNALALDYVSFMEKQNEKINEQ